MPNLAGIFWLRLLAKNKCTSTAELIEKGFNCDDDADFFNALTFSSGAEQSAYLDIQAIVRSAKKALKTEILTHEYNCKMRTDVLKIKEKMFGDIETRKKKLFSLWSDLENTEQELYTLEKDCCLLSKEYSETLEEAAKTASSMKTEVYRLEECTADSFHRYQVKIGSILQQSEQAKNSIENMKKQHPWVASFNELVKKRDEQVRLVSNELSSLRNYEAAIQQTLNEIDRIEERHRNALRAIENYDFQDAANLLGRECYNQVFHGIGLGVDVQLSVPVKSWQPDTTDNTLVDNNTDNDMDDYYSAWGLPNDSY